MKLRTVQEYHHHHQNDKVMSKRALVGNYSIPQSLEKDLEKEYREEDADIVALKQELAGNSYHKSRYNRTIDFKKEQTYKEIMAQRELEREEDRVQKKLDQQQQEQQHGQSLNINQKRVRKQRWDVSPEEYEKALRHLDVQKVVRVRPDPLVGRISLTDEVLDKLLPAGYRVVPFPSDYEPTNPTTQTNKTLASTNYYTLPTTQVELSNKAKMSHNNDLIMTEIPELEFFKEEDAKYFGQLAKSDEPKTIESQFMKLLLKVKNGTQQARKKSLRQISDHAKQFGATLIFNQVLPILLEPNLELQERHILIKLIGRVLLQLEDETKPFTHKILVVVAPLLIDEDFSTRMEAREIVLNLSRAVGFSTIISSLRPDLDHVDEYIRNTTSRVFAIVANTLGIVNILPFLKAVIKSKKNWMARHTGIKIVQQICVNLGGGNGASILPYLSQLIATIKPALEDEALQVRTISALAIAQLAEIVKPYGIEAFEVILQPVWNGVKRHRGKGLSSFILCVGSVVSLMNEDPSYEEYTNHYTRAVLKVMAREFQSPDEDMKKATLKVLTILPLSATIVPDYKVQILTPFFQAFWNRRSASDSQYFNNLIVSATAQLANKFSVPEVLNKIVVYTKDDNEALRKMSVDAIHNLILLTNSTLIGISPNLEISLVDGVLYAFQQQNVQHKIYLLSLGSLATALGVRMKPHMNSIVSTILFRMKNKSAEVRQQACDLICVMAPTLKLCEAGDDQLLMKLVLFLYESLGEVYPEVLGSIINAIYFCIENMEKSSVHTMQNPSVNQLLPTITPILKNRQEKVQEACIKLVGLIAQKNSESISAKEWMRVSFELLDMLKSSRKRIRVAANSTFGFISKTIGPQDILVMLLNNLRVQERQLRVCTAVAIGIVAETCAPFTVLPALMNEYKIPDTNVQNGVLKAMSFLFEYIDGQVSRDYLYSIVPLLEDALTDRDLVHRQTAATVVKSLAYNCMGVSHAKYFYAFLHLLNLLLPNIYETSPHVINRVLESLDSLRNILGVGTYMNYVWAGLFHPASKVRRPFWKLFNRAYIQNCDILVPYYPSIDVQGTSYDVEELQLIL